MDGPVVSPAEETALFEQYWPAVQYQARQFHRRFSRGLYAMQTKDIEQMAAVGLLEAIRKDRLPYLRAIVRRRIIDELRKTCTFGRKGAHNWGVIIFQLREMHP